MQPRSRVPNPYRCLSGLRMSVLAVLAWAVLYSGEAVVCAVGPGEFRPQVPFEYSWMFALVALAGFAHTLYMAYRDFFQGRYYLELSNAQRL